MGKIFSTLFKIGSGKFKFRLSDYISPDDGKILADTDPLSILSSIDEIKEAATSGDTDAQYLLGIVYYLGYGVQQDYTESIRWTEKSAKQGNMYAQNFYGECLDLGVGVNKDSAAALGWKYKSASQGLVPAMSGLGVSYFRKENYPEALRWFERAAKKNDAKALYMMGEIFHRGLGVSINEQLALKYYLEASKQNHKDACHMVGALLMSGKGAERNPKQALYYYDKAAQLGNTRSVYQIGRYFYNQEEYDTAVPYLCEAANKGDADAQYLYATCFILEGLTTVSSNPKEALKWLRKAQSQGNKDAIAYINRFMGKYW